MRSLGFTAKQANGSSRQPMGTDSGKLAVSTWSLDSRFSCGDSVRVGPEVEATSVIGKGVFSVIVVLTTALLTSKSTWDHDLSDCGGNNCDCGLDAGCAGFGGPKKLVMVIGLSCLASTFSLCALLDWWLRRFASPPLIKQEHTLQYHVSIFCKWKMPHEYGCFQWGLKAYHYSIDRSHWVQSKARRHQQWESEVDLKSLLSIVAVANYSKQFTHV